jgi:hypothetical protein
MGVNVGGEGTGSVSGRACVVCVRVLCVLCCVVSSGVCIYSVCVRGRGVDVDLVCKEDAGNDGKVNYEAGLVRFPWVFRDCRPAPGLLSGRPNSTCSLRCAVRVVFFFFFLSLLLWSSDGKVVGSLSFASSSLTQFF